MGGALGKKKKPEERQSAAQIKAHRKLSIVGVDAMVTVPGGDPNIVRSPPVLLQHMPPAGCMWGHGRLPRACLGCRHKTPWPRKGATCPLIVPDGPHMGRGSQGAECFGGHAWGDSATVPCRSPAACPVHT